MFDALILRARPSTVSAQPLNLGELAETLFFYREVHVTADRAVLKQLLQDIGPELLLVLLSEFHLKITYLNDGFGIFTHAAGSCSSLQTVARELANKRSFRLTFRANKLKVRLTIFANEPTFGSCALLVIRVNRSEMATRDERVAYWNILVNQWSNA